MYNVYSHIIIIIIYAYILYACMYLRMLPPIVCCVYVDSFLDAPEAQRNKERRKQFHEGNLLHPMSKILNDSGPKQLFQRHTHNH